MLCITVKIAEVENTNSPSVSLVLGGALKVFGHDDSENAAVWETQG